MDEAERRLQRIEDRRAGSTTPSSRMRAAKPAGRARPRPTLEDLDDHHAGEAWSSDCEFSVDEIADGVEGLLSVDARSSGDGAITGMDLRAPV